MTFNELTEKQQQKAFNNGYSGMFGENRKHGIELLESARATGDSMGICIAMAVLQNANAVAAASKAV